MVPFALCLVVLVSEYRKGSCLVSRQDASVRLIRELREEIDRLKSMLISFKMVLIPRDRGFH